VTDGMSWLTGAAHKGGTSQQTSMTAMSGGVVVIGPSLPGRLKLSRYTQSLRKTQSNGATGSLETSALYPSSRRHRADQDVLIKPDLSQAGDLA
jgi:hypothetical protein